MSLETWEFLSYVVTVVGLPLAIAVYLYEQRKERANEEEAVYQLLSDNYQDFLRVVLEHADLRLFSSPLPDLTEEQRERRVVVFGMLISLFERAYLLLFEPSLIAASLRRHYPDQVLGSHSRASQPPSRPRIVGGEEAPPWVGWF